MGTTDNNMRSWKQHVARISAQIEELKVWSYSQHRLLRSSLDAQIVELQSEITLLESEIAAGTSNEYAGKIARQIEELTAKGDAVYELLLAVLARRGDKVDDGIEHTSTAQA